MRQELLSVLCIGVCLSGCAHAQKYERPAAPITSTWPQSATTPSQSLTGAVAAETKWQDFFTDKNLQSVIGLALSNNRDLRIAALNVDRTQALYRIQRSQQFPELDATAGADLYRVPKDLSATGGAYTYRQYNLGGSVNWELDLFGRVRSLKREALEQFFSTEQARSAAQISLVAQVANTYLTLAADRENLKLAQATLDAQQASLELVKQTRDAGIGSDLDLRQAESQVEAARVDIARYTGQISLDENALNLLVGAPVAATLLPNELDTHGVTKELSAGLPSDVLLRRPDISAAEHQLKSANANIGAARAALFPRITLTGGGGVMSPGLSDLFKNDPQTWSFSPQIVLPIFDAGARRANLKVARIDRDVAVAEYEKAIQSGFREVSDSLTLRSKLTEQQEAQQALVGTLEDTYRLSDLRYKAGIDGYLTVLVAQRSMYAAQQALVNLRLARQSNLVTLYKVLGGGV
ncbi:MAG TPA: efflux transporter outer membrane subunit [Candidatus Saccharimonadales bacterium]|nr:efflux transporter outer membrane subunit [Candidatus Saccharimonadales bacterium]